MKVDTSYFKPILEAWVSDHCGPKPTTDNFAVALSMPNMGGKGTKRPGHEALFVAMALRTNKAGEPIGCTRRQHGIAGDCGPALNYTRWLISAGYMKGGVVAGGRPMAYTLTLTKKGEAQVKRVAEAAEPAGDEPKAKPKKEAKASKPRKPRAKKAPATEPTDQPEAPLAPQAPAEQPEQTPVT